MRTNLTLRRTAAAAVAVPLLVAGLTACGDKSSTATDDPAGGSSSSSAPNSPDAQPSASAGETIAPADFVDTLKQSMANATTAHLEMNMAVAGQTIKATGQVDYTGDTPAMQMTMTDPTGSGGDIDMRLVGKTMYFKMGQLGDKFMKMSLDDPNSPLGQMSSLTDNMDPRKAMDAFAPALKKVTYIGDETVDGQQLKHYKLSMDPSEISTLKDMGATSGMPKRLNYDIWLDDQSRMTKMTMDMGSQMKIDMRYFDWDKPVDISAPPASEVTDMPSMPGMSPSS